MTETVSTTATQFQRNLRKFYDETLRGNIVEIERYSEVKAALVPAEILDEYRRLKRQERRAYRTEDMPDDMVRALDKAEYGVASE